MNAADLRAIAAEIVRLADQVERPATPDGHKVHRWYPPGLIHAEDDACEVLTCLEWSAVRRFDRHLAEHGCEAYVCEVAQGLFSAQPGLMKVAIG